MTTFSDDFVVPASLFNTEAPLRGVWTSIQNLAEGLNLLIDLAHFPQAVRVSPADPPILVPVPPIGQSPCADPKLAH